MSASNRKKLYIGIIAICVFSIIVGLVSEVGLLNGGGKKPNQSSNTTNDGGTIYNPEPDEFFDEMYNNATTKDDINFDESKFKKMRGAEPLVWEFYFKDVANEKFNVVTRIPCINLSVKQDNGENIKEINQSIQDTFCAIVNKITKGQYSENVIYSGDYAGFIYDNQLSLVIRSKMKVGNNTQDMIVKTYNIDLNTLKNLNLEEELSKRGYSVEKAEGIIKDAIKAKNKYAEDLKSSNLTPYERNVNSDMYKIENTTEFFITNKGDLYVVYSYGNSDSQDTTEKDVIKFEAKK